MLKLEASRTFEFDHPRSHLWRGLSEANLALERRDWIALLILKLSMYS